VPWRSPDISHKSLSSTPMLQVVCGWAPAPPKEQSTRGSSDGQVQFGPVLSEFSRTLNRTLGSVQHFG
jgi:hypothetical protein